MVRIARAHTSSTTAARDVALGGARTKVHSIVAGLLDELMHITPGIAQAHEVKGIHFSKWGEGNPEALWGSVIDLVGSMEPAPCE